MFNEAVFYFQSKGKDPASLCWEILWARYRFSILSRNISFLSWNIYTGHNSPVICLTKVKYFSILFFLLSISENSSIINRPLCPQKRRNHVLKRNFSLHHECLIYFMVHIESFVNNISTPTVILKMTNYLLPSAQRPGRTICHNYSATRWHLVADI